MTPIFWTNSRDLKPATTSVCACPWSLFPGQRPGPPCHSPQISHQQFFNLSCYCLDMQYTEGTIVSSSINFLACVEWLALLIVNEGKDKHVLTKSWFVTGSRLGALSCWVPHSPQAPPPPRFLPIFGAPGPRISPPDQYYSPGLERGRRGGWRMSCPQWCPPLSQDGEADLHPHIDDP